MACYEDLTPYTYTPNDDKTVVNIGWLEMGHEFETGPTSEEFRAALARLCKAPILLHRGHHDCQFCDRKWDEWPIASGQIRVLGQNGKWYAAPTLVIHYVEAHEYLPPAKFIDAVLNPVAIGTDDRWS